MEIQMQKTMGDDNCSKRSPLLPAFRSALRSAGISRNQGSGAAWAYSVFSWDSCDFWMLQKSACTRQKACYTVNVNVRMYYTIQTMGCCSDWRKSNIGTSRLRCQYPDSEIKHWTVEHLSIACLIPWYFVVSLVDFPFQEAKESLRAFTFIHRWLSASSNQRKHQHKRSHSVDHRLRRLRIVDFCHHAFALTTASTTHDIDGRSLLSVRFLCFDDPTITISPSNLLVPMHMNHCQSIHVRIEQISAWPSRL